MSQREPPKRRQKKSPFPWMIQGRGQPPAHGEGEGKEQGGKKLMKIPPAVTTPYIATRKKGTSYDLP